MRIAITPHKEVEARWSAYRQQNGDDKFAQRPPPRPINLEAVLDLEQAARYHFRGRAYGVPPMPWPQGVALMSAWTEASNMGESIKDNDQVVRYYALLQRMARIMWQCSRPVSRLHRMLKFMRLTRNPFKRATEREIVDKALFFLGLRMRQSAMPARPGLDARAT